MSLLLSTSYELVILICASGRSYCPSVDGVASAVAGAKVAYKSIQAPKTTTTTRNFKSYHLTKRFLGNQ